MSDVEAMAHGADEAGWEVLYRAHYASTVRLAGLLVGDYHVGEEIAQDAFARLFEAGARVRQPVAYLRATVVNLCRSRIRRLVVERRHRAARSSDPVVEEGTDRVIEQATIRDALRRLSRRQREVVVLRHFAEMSEAETAKTLGISAGSVKTHLHRAMSALAADLEALR